MIGDTDICIKTLETLNPGQGVPPIIRRTGYNLSALNYYKVLEIESKYYNREIQMDMISLNMLATHISERGNAIMQLKACYHATYEGDMNA